MHLPQFCPIVYNELVSPPPQKFFFLSISRAASAKTFDAFFTLISTFRAILQNALFDRLKPIPRHYMWGDPKPFFKLRRPSYELQYSKTLYFLK